MKRWKIFLIKQPAFLNILSLLYRSLLGNRRKINGNGNSIKCKGAFLKNSKIEIYGDKNEIIIEPLVKMKNLHIFIKGNQNRIEIGRECVGKDVEIWIEDNNNTAEIGSNTWFNGKIHMAVTESTTLQIGKKCLFAEDIIIRTGDSHSVLDEYGKRINNAKSVKIGNHVWIGNRAILLKGAKVGEGSVVGTGSIVTKEFKDHIVLAGVPARIARESICWDSERL